MAAVDPGTDSLALGGALFDAIWRAANEGLALSVCLPTGEDWEIWRGLTEVGADAIFHEYRHIDDVVPDRCPENFRIVYVMGVSDSRRAVQLLKAGQTVACTVPDDSFKLGWFLLGDQEAKVYDGDAHDLRCVEPAGGLVMFRQSAERPLARAHVVKQLQAAHDGGA